MEDIKKYIRGMIKEKWNLKQILHDCKEEKKTCEEILKGCKDELSRKTFQGHVDRYSEMIKQVQEMIDMGL